MAGEKVVKMVEQWDCLMVDCSAAYSAASMVVPMVVSMAGYWADSRAD